MGNPHVAKYTGLQRPNMVSGSEQAKAQQLEVQTATQPSNSLPPYIMVDPKNPESMETQMFTSTKQI